MVRRVMRWIARALGALSIAYTLFLAFVLIFETLTSNMIRAYAVMACVVFLAAAIIAVRYLHRLYFTQLPDLTITVRVVDESEVWQ